MMTENTQKKNDFFKKKYWTVLLGLTILIALFVLKAGFGTSEDMKIPRTETLDNKRVTNVQENKQNSGQAFSIAKNGEKTSPGNLRPGTVSVMQKSSEAELKAELFELESEKEALKRELIEISKKHEELLKNIGRADLALAEICSPTIPDKKLDEKKMLESICGKADRLALSGSGLAGKFIFLADKYEKDPVKKAEYLLMADSFRNDLAGLVKYTQGPSDEPVRKCRVLATSEELMTVAVNAGYMNGIRNGISLYGPGNIKLKVILCRPFLAAALVTEGRLSDIAPGMEISLTAPKE